MSKRTVRAAFDLPRANISEIAAALGVSESTARAYRNGQRRLPPETRKRLAAWLRKRGATLAQAADRLEA